MSTRRRVSIELNEAQTDALLAFVGSVDRSDVRALNDQGASIEVQPAMEAIVALSHALKRRAGL